MVRALRLGGRAAAAARWCTCRRAAVAICVANLVAALLVARALYAPGSFAFAPKRTLSLSLSRQLTVSSCDCSEQINPPIKFVPVALGGELKYSREQMRWVEESIRIRRAAEPVELIEAVIAVLHSSCVWNSICSGVPFEAVV
jgi:hypothetical protein